MMPAKKPPPTLLAIELKLSKSISLDTPIVLQNGELVWTFLAVT